MEHVPAAGSGTSPTVLLITARPASVWTDALMRHGCSVACYASSHAAFSSGLIPTPQAVLVDAELPLLPAETVVTALRDYLGRTVPILILPRWWYRDGASATSITLDQLSSLGVIPPPAGPARD